MKFLLDEDVHPEMARVARGLGREVISVHEIDRCGLPDDEQLRFAVSQGRILVTRNRDDFIQLTVAFFEAGEPHCGVLIVPYSLPNKDPKRMAHALERWCARQHAEPVPYYVDFLSA